eukprot:m.10132 g.10132  ORF g.10132 m.10132 type:complete len:156 (+) comp5933_c0_seq1:240-707(+)
MAGQGVTKRLRQELMSVMMSKDASIKAFPEGDNLFQWKATIVGAEGTAYASLKYKLTIKFPTEYPYSAPVVTFDTPCFHPNVDNHGNICLDILKDKWSPSYDIRTVLLSIQSLLGDPNVDSPLNCHAAELWANPKVYKEQLSKHYQENVVSKAAC